MTDENVAAERDEQADPADERVTEATPENYPGAEADAEREAAERAVDPLPAPEPGEYFGDFGDSDR